MTIEEVKQYIKSSETYNFLREYPHKIAFLILGGSYSYGTNVEDSDIDLRGVFLNDKRDILLGNNFEKVDVHNSKLDNKPDVDTSLYALKKYIYMCAKGDISCIGLLFNNPECHLYVSDIGRDLIKNRDMFLSSDLFLKIACYANSCMKRMYGEYIIEDYFDDEKIKNLVKDRKKHVYKSMMTAYRVLQQGINLRKQGNMFLSDCQKKIISEIRNGEFCQEVEMRSIAGRVARRIQPIKEFYKLMDIAVICYSDATKDIREKNLNPDIESINNFLMNVNEYIVKGMV